MCKLLLSLWKSGTEVNKKIQRGMRPSPIDWTKADQKTVQASVEAMRASTFNSWKDVCYMTKSVKSETQKLCVKRVIR